MAKPEDFTSISEYINSGKTDKPTNLFDDLDSDDEDDNIPVRKIKSSSNARESFHKERNKKFDKTNSAARRK